MENVEYSGILSSDDSNELVSNTYGSLSDTSVAVTEIGLYNLKQISTSLCQLYNDDGHKSQLVQLHQIASELNSQIMNHLTQSDPCITRADDPGCEVTRQYILTSFSQLKTLVNVIDKAVASALESPTDRGNPALECLKSTLSILTRPTSLSEVANMNYIDERLPVMYFTCTNPDISQLLANRIEYRKISISRASIDLRSTDRKLRTNDHSEVQSLITDTATGGSCNSRIGVSTATRSATPLSHDYAYSEYSTGQISINSSGDSNEDTTDQTTPIMDNQASLSYTGYSVSSSGVADETLQIQHQSTKTTNPSEVTDKFNMFELHSSSRQVPDDAKSNVSENWSTVAGASEHDPFELENRLCDVVEDNPIVQDLMKMHPIEVKSSGSDCWSIEPTPSETDTTILLLDLMTVDEAETLGGNNRNDDTTSTSSNSVRYNAAIDFASFEKFFTLTQHVQKSPTDYDDSGPPFETGDQPICGFDIAFPLASSDMVATSSSSSLYMGSVSMNIPEPEEIKSFSALKDLLRTIFIRSDPSVLNVAQQLDEDSNLSSSSSSSGSTSAMDALSKLLKAQYSQHVMTGNTRTQRKISQVMHAISLLTNDRCVSLLNMIFELCRTCRTLFLNSSARQDAMTAQIQRLDDVAPNVDYQLQITVRSLLHSVADLLTKEQPAPGSQDLEVRISSNRSNQKRCLNLQACFVEYAVRIDAIPTVFANESVQKSVIRLQIERNTFARVYLMLMFPEGSSSTESDRFFSAMIMRQRDSLLPRLRRCSSESIDELALLNACKTPKDKLNCLLKVISNLSNNRRRIAWMLHPERDQTHHQLNQQQQQSTSAIVSSLACGHQRSHCMAYAIVKANPPYLLCNLKFIKNYSLCSIQETNQPVFASVLKFVDTAVQIIRSYSKDDSKL
ncbi:hypothetical protein ACOME3_009504 [Neoechinorhynchus agilis]